MNFVCTFSYLGFSPTANLLKWQIQTIEITSPKAFIFLLEKVIDLVVHETSFIVLSFLLHVI